MVSEMKSDGCFSFFTFNTSFHEVMLLHFGKNQDVLMGLRCPQ